MNARQQYAEYDRWLWAKLFELIAGYVWQTEAGRRAYRRLIRTVFVELFWTKRRLTNA